MVTIVEEDILVTDTGGFEWGAVAAGAVIAAGVTFFLILVGAALGLSLAGTRNLTAGGAHSFLTVGAIYFFAAQAFGFAVGGHVTGRLMRPTPETGDEHFRADAHGLAVWSLAVILGFGLVAATAAAGFTPPTRAASQPIAYWADKLLTGAPLDNYAVRNGEVSRLLTADMANPAGEPNDDHNQLVSLIIGQSAMSPPVAEQRVEAVENGIRAEADAARHGALYLAMWTVFALLFGAFAAIAATVMARWHQEREYRETRIWKRS